MNFGEIKAQIKDYSHRTDIDALIPDMVWTVTQRLLTRLGELNLQVLVADSDTNIILDKNSQIYLYGSLREVAIYAEDDRNVEKFEGLYQKEIAQLNINYDGEEWDNTVPVILSETEQEVA